MPQHQTSLELPYSAKQCFELAANIERYPDLFAEFRQVRLLERGDHELRVEQTLSMGPLMTTFTSKAVFTPYSAIRIQAEDGPFDALTIDWAFSPTTDQTCRVSLSIDYSFRQQLLNTAVALFISRRFPDVLRRFQHQATLHLSQR